MKLSNKSISKNNEIREIRQKITKLLRSDLSYIMIYGSVARREKIKKDVDIIIAVRDALDVSSVKYEIEKLLFDKNREKGNILDSILFFIENFVGMNKSTVYICNKSDLEKADFDKIFCKTRPIISSCILAPKTYILSGLKQDGKILYGNKKLLKEWNIKIRNSDRLRGFIRSMLFNFIALLVFPILKKKSVEYSFYSIKSGILDSYTMNRGAPPKNILSCYKFFYKDNMCRQHLNNFENYRKGLPNRVNVIKTFIFLIKIYWFYEGV